MSVGNPRLELQVRNAVCTDCRLSTEADGDNVCITGSGPIDADLVVVTRIPLSDRARSELDAYLREAGIDPDRTLYTAAAKCKTWEIDPNKTDLKACKPYLNRELDVVKPDWILALGNEALFSTTGHSGIMKYRGKMFTHPSGAQVFATISPSMVTRNPGQRGGFLSDLHYLASQMNGTLKQAPHHLPGDVYFVEDKQTLGIFLKYLDRAKIVSFDIESHSQHHGASEFDPDAVIVSLSVTLVTGNDMSTATCWAIPLYHPESVWRTQWIKVLRIIGKRLSTIKKAVAHNGKFDARWLKHFGVDRTVTFDTMIAAYTLDENRPKGLKPLAQSLLGAEPWGIDTRNLLNDSIEDVLWYNALDTWHTMRLYFVFRQQLSEHPRLLRVFTRLRMPAAEEFVAIERRGIWVDTETLASNHIKAGAEQFGIESKLETFLPDEVPFPINWNPSNFLKWFLYDHLQLPILERGKAKTDGSPGDPSCREAVMMELAEMHEVPQLLLERTKWYRYCNAFFKPYAEQLDENHRIHSTFNLAKTSTGRLSSGKPDVDKVTAKRQIRGVNVQQVPRDVFVRGIFGAPPGSLFVQADYSQVELRIAAFLARERAMLHLFATGQDVHMATAMRMTGKPAGQVTKEERKKAKAVNFGFLFGMGWEKFIATAWENYQVRVTEEEARAFRTAFFQQFPDLLRWHGHQRALVKKYGRVQSPLGVIRHLPDIHSTDHKIRAEAERQAINSPVQGFASDMTLLSLVEVSRQFRDLGLQAHSIGTVHDAVNYEVPEDEVRTVLPIIKDTMENLPLRKKFGVVLDVPLIADISVGMRWGGARELQTHEVYDWKGA